ncbi:MAG: hypothetical protein DMG75_06415 [Acidobacteria bacterium]|nr:MAG: hypothetical protein DMG75_06415 [Acidobacteriota bacterium]
MGDDRRRHIAEITGKTDPATAERIQGAVLGLGSFPPLEIRSRNILRRLQADKKTRHGVVHFVLPRQIGKVEVATDVPEDSIRQALHEIRRLSHL